MKGALPEDVPTAYFRRALEAREREAVLALCSDGVALRSPVTETVFRGYGNLGGVLDALFATLSDVQFVGDYGDGDTRALFATAVVDGQSIDVAFRVELHGQEKVNEITLFVRPLSGLAAVGAQAIPRIARRYGRPAYWFSRIVFTPLAAATRLEDRLSKALVTRLRKRERS